MYVKDDLPRSGDGSGDEQDSIEAHQKPKWRTEICTICQCSAHLRQEQNSHSSAESINPRYRALDFRYRFTAPNARTPLIRLGDAPTKSVETAHDCANLTQAHPRNEEIGPDACPNRLVVDV